MSEVNVYAAIDAGGTKTLAVIFDARGRRLGEARSGPANQHDGSVEEAGRRLTDAVAAACREAGIRPGALTAVGAGLAGVGLGRPTPDWFRALWPVPSRAAWDAVAAFRGAFGREVQRERGEPPGSPGGTPCFSQNLSPTVSGVGRYPQGSRAIAGRPGRVAPRFVVQPGAVILAGTGSAVYACGAEGREARVGGWGPDVPSEWGADRIARDAVAAAVEAEDGRQEPSLLTRRIRRKLGLPDVARFLAATRGVPRTELASLSAEVGRAAAEGDLVAGKILRRAALEMARAVRAGLERVGLRGEPTEVSYAGSVFRAGPEVLEPLEGFLREVCPEARLVAPRGDPVYGAYLIARDLAGIQRRGAETGRRR